MSRYINAQTIDDIALGAAVLGTGGGGDPYVGSLMAKHALKNAAEVPIFGLDEIKDDDIFVPCSMIGATTVVVEKIMSASQFVRAFDAMEKALERPITATFPIEVGGINSLMPFVVAAAKGLPVIDCDAMGRAFPEAQMVTFFLDGLSSAPNTLADEKGNTVTLNPIDGMWSERLARMISEQMGAACAMCDYPLLGSQLKRSAIKGTLTLAQDIGKTLRESHRSGSHPVQSLLTVLNGHIVASGKIVDVARRTAGGFARGKVVLDGMGNDKGESFTVLFQNELLLAYRSSQVKDPTQDNLLAVVPDLISILDSETGRPIITEHLRYGQRVDVIAYPCNDKWRTPKGIDVAGPEYFGYPVQYVPIELLANR
ncbi:DUF917 domain-containing protein [Pectobacterium versatile]|uniref:DUF917 domain-containing protein n=1 Tax=Pectobacterium versatile TaxID=2488639 RepID=UPI000B7BE5D4|nr:DUF917 domain-containing protein [Pectobacterium versatile]ASN85367.1 Hypothetical protein SCC1_1932 [Pectobacterium versatile]MBQ4762564.1 DUF917 family protein [Pectobacterium versatile]RJL53343.1 DUF917 domain-containing protein [Pectobacterium versatile]RJL63751.1 DUF917 domain-containing protein [Pectobacterium versatile]RJL64695.1 DUF917 domain-containing protein [Pectobacterium versatile]